MLDISHLINNSNFEVVEHDICEPYFTEVDEIYNLACPASPVHYQYDAIKTVKTSVLGVINMLGLAKRTNAKILQASTSEIYGDPIIHPQIESYWGNVNPIGIRSCYDEGKRCAETLFMDYHRQNGVRIKITRIFNTYGNGQQTRSFQHVSDLIDGMIRLMNTPDDFVQPVNIGNPEEFTILELAEKNILLTNSKSKIVFSPAVQDDPQQRQPDITLAKQVLNWQPKIKLEEGLIKTIKSFKPIIVPLPTHIVVRPKYCGKQA
ncbi:NAD-dependent dehydratase [Bacteroidia bacterium]|nr:NAD-dependent dehydratase [Bacteroidia bacterium]